ncbi:uncharacterized protein LOC108735769 [Agrilus planipennis]|uniref:Uncharacterized protein LOC108735769 n=1 Tax=Agrilus planipennis TaxID=224129 RepID=A0A7F5RFE3_AGRPL|nr:uncharacterized protein LOC108735769 [Agrilus planipennis]
MTLTAYGPTHTYCTIDKEETRASELLIRKLKEEEELEKSIIEEKLKNDEQVAKQLAEELCFDPGPSTSKHSERSFKKRGPLDTFLRNMANKQLSVSLKPIPDEKCDNYRKKDFTTQVLLQDRSASLIKNNDSITFYKLNKVASERQSLDSNDAITCECIYFKPIEQKKIPPSKTIKILRVPAVAALSSSSTLRAPCGHVAFNHSALLSPFVRLCNSPTLALSPSLKTGFMSRKRSNSSCEKEESQDNKDSAPSGKKARIQLNLRQTRSMTKINSGSVPIKLYKKPEKRKSLLKNIKTSPRKTGNKCNESFGEEENEQDKKRLDCEFDRSFGSPFLGFEKNYKFSLKGRNGVKNLSTIFDNFNSNNKSLKDDNLKSKSLFDDKNSSYRNGEHKSENAEKIGDRNNGISLNNIELVIGAKCLRSESTKRKLQEEEDFKLARKLHEELNYVKYPTRNSISHISKKFPTPRRQITLYKFLEK